MAWEITVLGPAEMVDAIMEAEELTLQLHRDGACSASEWSCSYCQVEQDNAPQ